MRIFFPSFIILLGTFSYFFPRSGQDIVQPNSSWENTLRFSQAPLEIIYHNFLLQFSLGTFSLHLDEFLKNWKIPKKPDFQAHPITKHNFVVIVKCEQSHW